MIQVAAFGIVILLTLIFSALFAKLSRMCGGGAPHLDYGLDAHLYALPYGIAGAIVQHFFIGLIILFPVTIPAFVSGFCVAYATAFLGKRLGHGQYFDLASWTKKVKEERIDPLVQLVFGQDKNTVQDNVEGNIFRDFLGLTLTGTVVGLGLATLAFFAGHTLWAIIILLTASLKGVAYLIPRKFEKQTRSFLSKLGIKFDEESGHTEPGEWINGFFQGIGVFAYLFLMIAVLICLFVIAPTI